MRRKENREHYNAKERERYDKQKRHEKHLMRVYKVRERKPRETKRDTKPREKPVLPQVQQEHFRKKWEERQRKEERKAELKKIRTEMTYEKDGKIFYNFYIIRRLREFQSKGM